MKWGNVGLIFRRELVDQLRDRRTLFTVFLMPLLLYPVLGALMMQLANFFREKPSTVWVVGAANLPEQPALLEENRVREELAGADLQRLLRLQIDDLQAPFAEAWGTPEGLRNPDRLGPLLQEMKRRKVDLLAWIPDPIRLEAESLFDEHSEILLIYDSSSEASKLAAARWHQVVGSWHQAMLQAIFRPDTMNPGDRSASAAVAAYDAAPRGGAATSLWARILPLLVMVWCLTGAFYPAIDLCAGEKERGTLETLLSSPALRTEIALGKLGTVMVFSIATALLNLASMGMTAMLFFGQAGNSPAMAFLQGPPPLAAILMVLLATLPASALFGAFSLAAAAFARSSKEGQYYLIPLIMVSMPLMVIPLLPSAQLEMGTSLIPVTGVMLLVRGMIEGHWSQVLAFAGPVLIVCVACCALAVRWVVYQFNSEEILFRPSERFALSLWIRQLFRSRDAGPAAGHAVLCGVVILILKFASGLTLAPPGDWNSFAAQTFTILMVTVAVPAMLMAIILSRKPLETLLLRPASWRLTGLVVLLAVCLNPFLGWFSSMVMRLYPVDERVQEMAAGLFGIVDQAPSLLALLFVLAIAPAIFEELAFRGFVLSGFRSLAGGPFAVLLTSLLFGLAHGVIQQSMIAFVVGMILGLIAVQSNSLIPCILFHAIHNGLAVLLSRWDRYGCGEIPGWLEHSPENGWGFAAQPAIAMSLVAVGILCWLLRRKPDLRESGIIASDQQQQTGPDGSHPVPSMEVRRARLQLHSQGRIGRWLGWLPKRESTG